MTTVAEGRILGGFAKAEVESFFLGYFELERL
jgi:hypothetical protein